MQNYQLKIQAQWRPETLERILRVVRHRGFIVTAMAMQLENDTVQLQITVKSDRTLHLLTNQLIKLYGVIAVENA